MSPLAASQALRLRMLHCLARVALRVARPLRAKALVDAMGGAFPIRGGEDVARAAVEALFPDGSCLSRAITIAAILSGDVEVVIGMAPLGATRPTAHAWLQFEDTRVDTNPGTRTTFPEELARLPRHYLRGQAAVR